MPKSFKTLLLSRTNSRDPCLLSHDKTTPIVLAFSPNVFKRYCAKPTVAFLTVKVFILLEPGPITPRIPAVPNSISL